MWYLEDLRCSVCGKSMWEEETVRAMFDHDGQIRFFHREHDPEETLSVVIDPPLNDKENG